VTEKATLFNLLCARNIARQNRDSHLKATTEKLANSTKKSEQPIEASLNKQWQKLETYKFMV